MRSRQRKRPNAQKHGVFARLLIIPGEDPREFQELYAELLEEWEPTGPTQREAVFNLADSYWRKRRLQKYVETMLNLKTFDSAHPAFDEVWGSCMFAHYLRSEPETCFEKHARKFLRADKIDYLQRKFPRSNYQSMSVWAQVVLSEVLTLGSELEEVSDVVLREALREWKAEQKVAWSIAYARELLDYEFKETERLDARIARQINFLIELKAKLKMLCES